MSDILAFLRSRLDEQMRTALGSGGSVRARTWTPHSDRVDDLTGSGVVRAGEGAEEKNRARIEHIALHDPERVLADIEAKRKVVERYQLLQAGLVTAPDRETRLAEYRDLVLPALASTFADHPDYRDEWRL